jgi:hypothetical protein
MPQIIRCDQGSPEWLAHRLGRITASRLASLITPTGKPSASADGLLYRLVAEDAIGEPTDGAQSAYMGRGIEMEAEALDWYELTQGATVERVGGILSDCGRLWCSPDGLLGEDGAVEVKCPSAHVHVEYLLSDDASVAKAYRQQIQGSLMVSGRAWWDTLSYHPVMPPALHRVERDEEYIATLREIVDAFLPRLAEARARLADLMEEEI